MNWLARKFVKRHEQTELPEVRTAYGRLCGLVGIGSNLLLFCLKLLAGTLSGSIAITADALNNLTDAASSVVTLVGFQLSGRHADKEHPFGHGRIEYLAGLLVSLIILLVGVELLKTSIGRIISPAAVELGALSVVILLISICIKLLQYRFNLSVGKTIQSASLIATARDSLSDVVATAVILAGGVLGAVTGLAVDGFMGVFVAAFILRTGWVSAKETLNPLLGAPPSRELVERVTGAVLAHKEILGVHDLIIHDYGPGRSMMSLHAEVDYRQDMMDIHDVIDEIERELALQFHTVAVIHMDPIVVDDPQLNALRAQVETLVREVDQRLTIHDFRMTAGGRHVNMIFDVAVPYTCALKDEEVGELIRERVSALPGTYYAVMQIDRVYHES